MFLDDLICGKAKNTKNSKHHEALRAKTDVNDKVALAEELSTTIFVEIQSV